MLRTLRYGLEAFMLLIGFTFLRLLPLDAASALGGIIGRIYGPLTSAHRTAKKNLKRIFPEMSKAQHKHILRGMWDNIGRVMCEYPHLSRPIMRKRITVEGLEHLEEVKRSNKGSLFISGHFANWEVAPLTSAYYGLPLVLIYRAANNPVSDWIIRRMRSYYNAGMHKKGAEGARQALKAIKNRQAVAMVVDQKMNDGRPIDFMGYPAMTALAIAQLAIKYQLPLLAARVVRTDGVHFHITLEPPIMFDPSASAEEAMRNVNILFERWVREHPEQWFWVHNRWGFK